jgi:hypothetical protein
MKRIRQVETLLGFGLLAAARRPLMFAVFIQYPRDHRWCSTRNEPKSSDYPFRTDRASE